MDNTLNLAPGTNCLVRWEANPKGATPVKSNHVNGKRTKKIVLPTASRLGPKPKPGETWVCRIERVTNEKSEARGAIIVKPLTLEIDLSFPGVWVDPVKARLMSVVLQNREKNLMLVGDQGIGKTTLSRAVATKLGWKFRKVSGGLIKKFAYMLGRNMPVTGGATLTFKWVDSQLVKVIREALRNPEDTFLCMIDEYSRMDEDARDALLDVIEGDVRVLSLPTGEDLVVPENIHFMAAANEGGAFTVRKEDAAAKDRWVIIKVEHMPQPDELAHCLARFGNCPKAELDRALTIINKLRSMRHDLKVRLSKTISTRAAQNVAMFLANGIDLETALMTAVANQYEGSNSDINSEAGRVAKIISDELKK
ncbi:MAG TPA: AAA family ATPase [Candidatus Obscuribacterales bacterium]